jgi:hypothetical protein
LCAGAYVAWGEASFAADAFGVIADAVPEPNNLVPPEVCVVANASSQQGAPAVWGWADTRCIDKRQSLCRVLGRRHNATHRLLQCF